MFDESSDQTRIKEEIRTLRERHASLNAQVDALADTGVSDQLKFARLKKEKLQLKDEIAALEDQLHPDIIA